MAEQDPDSHPTNANNESAGLLVWTLNQIERLGNKLPDPAVLFLIGMVVTWVCSALLSQVKFKEIDPRSGDKQEPIRVVNLLTLEQAAKFLAGEDKKVTFMEDGEQKSKIVTEGGIVNEFVRFPPLGIVLVALLGVGVAEHSGFINACLKNLMRFTPQKLLTPMLILVGIMSHTAADAGYVLVIPLGGIIFYAAGRHPLAGIAAAFAGVSGGFSANIIPSGIDPLLSGITQPAAMLIDVNYTVNPLCNIVFTACSSVLIIVIGWFLTDFVVEPRLRGTKVDGDPEEMPQMDSLSARDQLGMWCGLATMLIAILLLVLWAWPADSALRASDGSLTSYRPSAPLMHAIVPLIFLLFVLPGIVHGFVSGKFKSHRDVIKGMTHSMETMGYYLVLVFFAALFIAAFRDSNIGVLVALKGAAFIQQTGAPPAVTIVGVILLVALVNLLIGSASAKWAMLAPIFVPMLMLAGLSPELTQAAYRVGDSCTNIITPMMPYFPLVVVFCQRYVKGTGIGTVAAMMLPYSVVLLVVWTLFLLAYWLFGLPLGLQAPYTYVPPG
jgi:para-aminobenzoyl-glutamate transporter family